MPMKKFYRVLIFSFLLHSPVFFSQIKSSDIINRTDGIDINLKFDKIPFIIQKENGKENNLIPVDMKSMGPRLNF